MISAQQIVPKHPDAAARVKNDEGIAAQDFHARGIPSVSNRALPGRRDRPSNSPELDFH